MKGTALLPGDRKGAKEKRRNIFLSGESFPPGREECLLEKEGRKPYSRGGHRGKKKRGREAR